ncbi:transposase [Alteromonas abrolhosensis]|uniref:transposase n=1 Tax=Alteromonas abrolhosensis TaxID=1892904 RepID=UPI003BA93CD7
MSWFYGLQDKSTAWVRSHSHEFKRDAVSQVVDRGYSVAEVAQRLGTTTHSLYAWKKRYGPDSAEHQEKTENEQEIRRLKKELRRVTEERDILKKATAYFAKETL